MKAARLGVGLGVLVVVFAVEEALEFCVRVNPRWPAGCTCCFSSHLASDDFGK